MQDSSIGEIIVNAEDRAPNILKKIYLHNNLSSFSPNQREMFRELHKTQKLN